MLLFLSSLFHAPAIKGEISAHSGDLDGGNETHFSLRRHCKCYESPKGLVCESIIPGPPNWRLFLIVVGFSNICVMLWKSELPFLLPSLLERECHKDPDMTVQCSHHSCPLSGEQSLFADSLSLLPRRWILSAWQIYGLIANPRKVPEQHEKQIHQIQNGLLNCGWLLIAIIFLWGHVGTISRVMKFRHRPVIWSMLSESLKFPPLPKIHSYE